MCVRPQAVVPAGTHAVNDEVVSNVGVDVGVGEEGGGGDGDGAGGAGRRVGRHPEVHLDVLSSQRRYGRPARVWGTRREISVS